MGSQIDIAVCFDQGIESAALVLLSSLRRRSGSARPVRVHALVQGISPRVTEALRGLDEPRFSVVLHEVKTSFPGLQARGHISVGTYLRFLLPELLTDCDKIVYLDVDLIVRHDIAELFDVPLGGQPLAAVPDFSQINSGLTWRPWRIRYDEENFTFAEYCRRILDVAVRGRRPYFNAGVLILDLAQWRRDKIAEATLDFLRAHPNLRFLDQDALNHVIGPNYARLDARWNAFAVHACPVRMHILDRWSLYGRQWQAIRTLWRDDPWIVHFAGPNKPWSPADEPTPLDHMWWDEARQVSDFARIEASYRANRMAAGISVDKSAVA